MKYFVNTTKDNINHLSNKKINNVTIKDNNITFETNEESLKKLLEDISELSYFNKRKIKIIIFLKKYLISILAILLLILFILNEQFVIKKIYFVNENTYSQEVIDYLYENNLEKKLFYYYLKDELNTINRNLKQKFYYYEWINVNKKGNVLQVYIDKQDEKSYLDVTSNVKGDIIASRDGIIRYYFIKKGVNLIKDNQSIKKGDVLVSGNLLINNEMFDYIHPLGIVLAEVADYEQIKIKKNNTQFLRTGKIEIINKYMLLNIKIDNECSFKIYEEENSNIFDYKIIKKSKTIYYEIKEIITIYNKEESKKYAYSEIEKQFNEKKIHSKEKIIDSILINESEDNEYFYYNFLVKKIINISEFKAVNLEEK